MKNLTYITFVFFIILLSVSSFPVFPVELGQGYEVRASIFFKWQRQTDIAPAAVRDANRPRPGEQEASFDPAVLQDGFVTLRIDLMEITPSKAKVLNSKTLRVENGHMLEHQVYFKSSPSRKRGDRSTSSVVPIWATWWRNSRRVISTPWGVPT